MPSASANSTRPTVYDHLKSRKRPITRKVLIVLDSDLAEIYSQAKLEHELAQIRLRQAPDNAVANAEEQEARVAKEAAEQAVRECSENFIFRSVGRIKFDKLITDNPPTMVQVDNAKAKGQGTPAWNEVTYPPALIAACLQSPELTYKEITDLWNDDNWAPSELIALFEAAQSANTQRRVVELGNG